MKKVFTASKIYLSLVCMVYLIGLFIDLNENGFRRTSYPFYDIIYYCSQGVFIGSVIALIIFLFMKISAYLFKRLDSE